MICKNFSEEKINRYIDHELGDKERSEFETHILRCGFCKNFLDEIRDALTRLKSEESINIPEKIWTKIEEKLQRKSYIGFIPRLTVAAVGVVVVLLVILNLFERNRNERYISDYMERQISYLHDDALVDNRYLEEEEDYTVVDLFLEGKL